MKNLLTVAVLLLMTGMARAEEKTDNQINWSVFVDTDAVNHQGDNGLVKTDISSDTTRINLPGASVKATVSPVQIVSYGNVSAEVRFLTVEFVDGSGVAVTAQCRREQVHDQSGNGLLIKNLGKLLQVYLECDVSEKKP